MEQSNSTVRICLIRQPNKIALSADDDKREICDNKIETFAHGHFTMATTVHDVRAKNRNTQGQTEGSGEDRGAWGTEGPWGTGAKVLKESL